MRVVDTVERFGRFVPPAIVEELAKSDESSGSGRRKNSP